MSTQAVHSVSTSLLQSDPQTFNQKVNTSSLADTIKKTAAVTGIVLGGTFFVTGMALVGIATGGIAIPIMAPFILGGLGAAGVTGGGLGLGYIKVNKAAKKVLIAAHLIKQETGNLEQICKDQGLITTSLIEKLENLKTQTKSLEGKLGQGDQGIKRAEQGVEITKKQKKEFTRDLNKIQTLAGSLNETLTKLQNLPALNKDIKTLEMQIDKMAEKLDQLKESLLRIEPSLKEHNEKLQQLRNDLTCLQGIKLSLSHEKPSSELEKIAHSLQLKKQQNEIRIFLR